MNVPSMFTVALALAIPGQLAFADAGHQHGMKATFGSPGKESEVTRTIEVEASDSMRFKPAAFEVKMGETVKFVVKNTGKVKHEFSIGDRTAQRAHAMIMKEMPDMKHEDDLATVTLDPGQTKTVIWKFDKKPKSPIEIACHEPGHYEAGMKLDVRWAK
ncbi:MAG TPA: cupredoxin family protein [Burkholderiales bacterium]